MFTFWIVDFGFRIVDRGMRILEDKEHGAESIKQQNLGIADFGVAGCGSFRGAGLKTLSGQLMVNNPQLKIDNGINNGINLL